MAEIILFRPKILKGQARAIRPRPPLGLLFIAAPLVRDGYSVKIIDEEISFSWQDELAAALDDSTICVGVSSMTGHQISGGLEFSSLVKLKKDIPVVWGGLHPTMLPQQTLENELVDIVVKGEGEEAFLNIVSCLKNREGLSEIPGVWTKAQGQIKPGKPAGFMNMDNIPILPYELLEMERYINIKRSSHPGCNRVFDLHTDRGCPHRCGFCYNINMNERKWRAFSAQVLLGQIEYLVNKFSLDGINFLGDNFFVDRKRVVDTANGILKRNLKITWHADCRIDYFVSYDDELIGLLKKSGCKVLTFGVESGSPKMLKLIDKDIDINDVFKVNEKLRRHKIEVNYHFMAGFPQETKDDLIQTYRAMLKLYEAYPQANFLGPSIYTPYPGTPLYDKSIELGFRPPQRLQDWINYGWTEDTSLSFTDKSYAQWLMKSARAVDGANVFKRIMRWKLFGSWFKFRLKCIVDFGVIIAPVESILINMAENLAAIFSEACVGEKR